ncbi:MAG: PSD1 and planctomycete cytochrome C domain-containing protein [Gemmataceae bacterium]
MKRLLPLTLALIWSVRAPAGDARPTAEQARFFEAKVRPLLVEHCTQCHGAKKQQGGLRLDTAAGFRAGGDTGPLVSATPKHSLLLKAVRHEGPKMPPKKHLAKEEIAVLADWVKMGAPWPETPATTRGRGVVTAEDRQFWSFRPVRDPVPPAINNPHLAANPIDLFLLAKLQEKGLSYNRLADRAALLRRLTYDLIGLPPTPEEVDAFLHDKRPDAYERLVDRLLASPAYGERWGRHWLDVVRFADTAGDNSDYPVPQLYLYRNWVLAALNRDQPFDEFTQEQIAGDLMPHRSPAERRDRTIATGYVASARRFGSYEDHRYQWYLTFEDTIENLGRSFLGLSLSCARCHDHKFDPIPSEDYYALYGFFQSTRYAWAGTELDKVQRDLVPIDDPARIAAAFLERQRQLSDLEKEIQGLALEAQTGPPEVRRALAERRKRRDALSTSPLPYETAYAVAEGKRWVGNARMHMRGDPLRPGKEVPRRFLQALGGQPLPDDVQGSGRLELARWITDPNNPLTARVLANRLWLYHFGKGIVPTPNDFGKQGQPPTHPELLDWLASRLVRSGWSLKAMHRLIVTSRAYRLSSEDAEGGKRLDPDNRLYWRFDRRRLDAESIRDTLLSLGGALDRSVGVSHPFPPMRAWDFTQHKPFKAVYDTDRRSVYLMTQRIQRHPYLALFDGPDPNASTAKRDSSTTPLQALFFLNDPLTQRLARAFADRLRRATDDEAGRVALAFRLAFGRSPTEEESRTALAYLEQARSKLRGAGEPEDGAWDSFVRGLFLSNELVYLD